MKFQIPDEALNQLRSMLEKDGSMQWEIGGFISDYWQELLKYVAPKEVKNEHALMIRDFARFTGADPSTLRDREKVYAFFTDVDRERYDTLTYHQFRALKSAGADHWEGWAVKALDGQWSVRKIRKEIKGEETPEEALLKRLTKIDESTRKILDDLEVRNDIRTALALIPSIIQDTKDLLHG